MFIKNKHCYDFQLRDYNQKGILDEFVDMTYIITDKDSTERNAQIEAQLVKLIPTKQIYFVYNSTYKKCNKQLPEQIPPYDLKDANLNIIQHSIGHGFNNILILENDFIYSDLLLDNTRNKEIVREIRDFFQDYKEKTFAYNLGPRLWFIYPNINPFYKHKNTFKFFFGTASQAVIYNKKIQHEIIKCNKDIYKHIDAYINFNFDVYMYKNPLIYQTFPETNNQQYWFNNKFIKDFVVYNIKILNLHKSPEPGFSINYGISFFISYLLFFLICFFVIWFLYFLFSLFFIKINIKNKTKR
jgi:hypothetical protein